MSATVLIGVALAAMAAFGLTFHVRRWALSRAIIDRPNARSLHAEPTPRGGGIAIALVVILAEVGFLWSGTLHSAWGWSGVFATLALAVIGFADDVYSLTARLRFALQVLVCGTWTAFHVNILAGAPDLGMLMAQLLLIVWIVNLYNFMDGSDGLAAVQAIAAGALGGGLAWISGATELAIVALLLAAASGGFLYWNWQPARIFLGDAGSYFLGGQFALLCVTPLPTGASAWFIPILLGPFFVDATLTLARRVIRRERWYTPHRTHAYQLLALSGWSHRKIACGLCVLIVIVCLPFASLAAWYPELGLACLLLSQAILGTIWWRTVRAHH